MNLRNTRSAVKLKPACPFSSGTQEPPVRSARRRYQQRHDVHRRHHDRQRSRWCVTSGDATNSYLYLKIIGQGAAGTLVQPPPGTGIALSQAQKDLVRDWINAGAKND